MNLALTKLGKMALAALAAVGCQTTPPRAPSGLAGTPRTPGLAGTPRTPGLAGTPRTPGSGGGLIRMHVETNRPGTVLTGAATCPAPCDRPIDGQKGQEFFFVAPGMSESRHFQILDLSGDVNARVDGGSRARQIAGYTIIGLGAFGILDGTESIVAGALIRAHGHEESTKDIGKGFQLGGYIALGVGAALLGTGIAIAYSGATTVELTPRGGRIAGRF